MILEVAILNIIPSKSDSFITEFRKAEKIISSMKGYISHELQRCCRKRISVYSFSKMGKARRPYDWFQAIGTIPRMETTFASFL
jgi:heme-degrading monooxygenase HmoA